MAHGVSKSPKPNIFHLAKTTAPNLIDMKLAEDFLNLQDIIYRVSKSNSQQTTSNYCRHQTWLCIDTTSKLGPRSLARSIPRSYSYYFYRQNLGIRMQPMRTTTFSLRCPVLNSFQVPSRDILIISFVFR